MASPLKWVTLSNLPSDQVSETFHRSTSSLKHNHSSIYQYCLGRSAIWTPTETLFTPPSSGSFPSLVDRSEWVSESRSHKGFTAWLFYTLLPAIPELVAAIPGRNCEFSSFTVLSVSPTSFLICTLVCSVSYMSSTALRSPTLMWTTSSFPAACASQTLPTWQGASLPMAFVNGPEAKTSGQIFKVKIFIQLLRQLALPSLPFFSTCWSKTF